MKKLVYIIFGLIVGALLTYYFCPREVNPGGTTKANPPKDTITVAQAKILSDNWANNNPTRIDSLIDVEGPRKAMRSVWWSLNDINEYLAYAQAKSDTLGYTMTGVRIYLGNYGKDAKPSKKNRNTMFIVPTGPKNINKGSSISLSLPPTDSDIPAPGLNKGTGGQEAYPN